MLAFGTIIKCGVFPHSVVPHAADRVFPASTFVEISPGALHRHSGQIVVASHLGLATKRTHDALPLETVWFDPTGPEMLVDHVVCNFVGHRLRKVRLKVPAKNMGVVADFWLKITYTEHSCGAPREIKSYRNDV